MKSGNFTKFSISETDVHLLHYMNQRYAVSTQNRSKYMSVCVCNKSVYAKYINRLKCS